MNKYQEALKKVYELISDLDFSSLKKCAEQLHTLQKLVDKETPKKIIIKKYDDDFYVGDYYCPHCNCKINEEFEPKYCSECGQKLDWSDELCHQK